MGFDTDSDSDTDPECESIETQAIARLAVWRAFDRTLDDQVRWMRKRASDLVHRPASVPRQGGRCLDSFHGKPDLTEEMQATISSKGQLVIPEALREQACLRQGDKVDIGYCDGLIVLRKRQPLTPARVRALLSASRRLPEATAADDGEVASAIREVRRSRRSAAR